MTDLDPAVVERAARVIASHWDAPGNDCYLDDFRRQATAALNAAGYAELQAERDALRGALKECVDTAADLRANLTPSGYTDPLPFLTYTRIWDASFAAEQRARAALSEHQEGR